MHIPTEAFDLMKDFIYGIGSAIVQIRNSCSAFVRELQHINVTFAELHECHEKLCTLHAITDFGASALNVKDFLTIEGKLNPYISFRVDTAIGLMGLMMKSHRQLTSTAQAILASIDQCPDNFFQALARQC